MSEPVNLVFRRDRYAGGPVNLVLGAEDGPPPAPPLTMTATVVLAGPVVSCIAVYNNRNPLRVSTSVATSWTRGERASGEPAMRWDAATPASGEPISPWIKATPASGEPISPWQAAQGRSHDTAAPWQQAAPAARETSLPHMSGIPRAGSARTRWTTGRPANALATTPYTRGLHIAKHIGVDASQARPVTVVVGMPTVRGHYIAWELVAPWGIAIPAPPGGIDLPPVINPPQPPREISTRLVFACPAYVQGEAVRLVFGRVCRSDPEHPQAPLYVLPARFYMSVHDLRAFVLPSMEEIPIFGVALTDAEGSFCRTFTATAPVEVEDALQPSDSMPVLVRIELDGLAFDYMIDRPQIDDGFGDRVLRFGGRSPTAAVARPWARESQRLSTAARNAQQLALEALEYTGVALDWGIVDWLIAAGAWSHSGTPLQAVQTLAEAAGAYVMSARTGAELLVRHPYPDFNAGTILGLPWNWYQPGVVPDVELAADVVDTLSRTWTHGGDIDGVWLSGVSQGILSHYKRAGTTGTNLAAPVTDPLILSSDVARWRGRSIVATGGLKQSITISAPIITGSPTSPGILERGQLVQINQSPPWRARVREVNVAAEFGGEVRQTLRLERHMEVAS